MLAIIRKLFARYVFVRATVLVGECYLIEYRLFNMLYWFQHHHVITQVSQVSDWLTAETEQHHRTVYAMNRDRNVYRRQQSIKPSDYIAVLNLHDHTCIRAGNGNDTLRLAYVDAVGYHSNGVGWIKYKLVTSKEEPGRKQHCIDYIDKHGRLLTNHVQGLVRRGAGIATSKAK